MENLGFPSIVTEIIKNLAGIECKAFEKFIAEVDDDVIESFAETIAQCWKKQQSDGKDKIFSIYDYQMTIVLAVERNYDTLRKTELKNNVGGVMLSRDADSWTSLIISLDDSMHITNIDSELITEKSFSSYDWKIVNVIKGQLLLKRK